MEKIIPSAEPSSAQSITTLTGPEPEPIKELFSHIAPTYDRANDVITFGMARLWRRKLVSESMAQPGDSVLDCATGTGDLAFDFKKVVGPTGDVVGCDFCAKMLESAPLKSLKYALPVEFELGDVTQLKYPDNEFNVSSIAYGIRNVENPTQALREMARVTQPGGRVMVLETGETRSKLLKNLLQIYFKYIMPFLGGWVSGNRNAYKYLSQSSHSFPCREKFVELMNSTGCFQSIKYKSLMGGASFIYTGVVK